MTHRTPDPLADLDLGRWARAHLIELVVALVRAGAVDLARDLAAAARVDLDKWAADARAELARRGLR